MRERRGTYIISFVKNKMNVSHITVPRNRNHNLFVSKPHLLNSSVETIVDFIAGHMEAKLIHPVLREDSDEDDGEEEDQDGGESLTVCHVCDKQVDNLSSHMDVHYITFCQVCEKIIASYSRWVGHKTACYPNMKMHQCPHCDFRTSRKNNFKRHTSKHLGGDTNFCDKCEKSFVSVFRLEKHIAQDHNNGYYYCKWCPKKFSARRNCAYHTKSCSGNPDRVWSKCNICGKTMLRHNPNHSSLQLMCTLSRVLFWLCKTTQKYTDQSYALLQVLFPLSWCSTSRDCFRRPDLQLRKLENANGLRTCTKTVAIFRPTHAGCLVR